MKKHYHKTVENFALKRAACGCTAINGFSNKSRKKYKKYRLTLEQVLAKLGNKGVCTACKRAAVVDRLNGESIKPKSQWMKSNLTGQSADGVIIDDPLSPRELVNIGRTTCTAPDVNFRDIDLDKIQRLQKSLGL